MRFALSYAKTTVICTLLATLEASIWGLLIGVTSDAAHDEFYLAKPVIPYISLLIGMSFALYALSVLQRRAYGKPLPGSPIYRCAFLCYLLLNYLFLTLPLRLFIVFVTVASSICALVLWRGRPQKTDTNRK
jgi:hypothetical protein